MRDIAYHHSMLGPAIAPYDPLASNVGPALQPPSTAHWFGTDALGRDIFSRVVVATRLAARRGGRRYRRPPPPLPAALPYLR